MCGGDSTVGSNPTGTATKNPRDPSVYKGSGGSRVSKKPRLRTGCHTLSRSGTLVGLAWRVSGLQRVALGATPRSELRMPSLGSLLRGYADSAASIADARNGRRRVEGIRDGIQVLVESSHASAEVT